jgi:hypothetical protein
VSRLLALIAIALVALSAAAAPAGASHTQSLTFEAPRDLLDPAYRDGALAELASLGVHSLRVVLYWHDVAPAADSQVRPNFDATDPAAYNWGQYDALIDAAAQRGWSVLLTVSGPVPRWATNGARNTVTRPSPNEFRRFVTAVARHYAGKVATWSIWNEPNHPQFLGPQYVAGRPASPRIYRVLYAAAIRGLHGAGLAHPTVLMGETAPRGTGHDVAPLTFLRGALCLNGHYRRVGHCQVLPVSGYAHHAYTTRSGPFFRPSGPNDVTIGVLGRLVRALDRAARAGVVAHNLPIYLTEFGIQSKPDPLIGVSLPQQAEFQAISERIAWANPRVVSFSQYLLRDDPPVPGVPAIARYSGFQSGLRTAGGKAKPALAAFRLPLVARRTRRGVALWGLVRPAQGATDVQILFADPHQHFRPLAVVRTDAHGYWSRHTALRAGRRWRVRWTASDGTLYTGPPIRAYR